MIHDIIDGLVDLPADASASGTPPTRAGDTVRDSGDKTSERRFGTRYPVDRSLIIIPLLADGRPDWRHRRGGDCLNVSPDGMGLRLGSDEYYTGQPFVVGVPQGGGVLGYTGLEIRFVANMAVNRAHLGARCGGFGDMLLRPESLAPRFHPGLCRLAPPIATDVLKAWEDVGMLKAAEIDRAAVCPRCRSIPTFRPGCANCGSASIGRDRLVHHFACAHVDFLQSFEAPDGMTCPKCRTRHLIVGADYDYQEGEFHCRDCNWAGTELEQAAQCLRCALRFPGYQAAFEELRSYHANRLDPLAIREAS